MGGLSDWYIAYTSTPNGLLREPEHHPSPSHLEGRFIDVDSDASSPFSHNSPPTPTSDTIESDRFTMPTTSPIDIATPTRNASSSPSSQGIGPGVKPTTNFLDPDSRTSAMMSGTTFDQGAGRGRQDSFAGAKPISMNNPNRNADGRPRRESLAGSLVQGMSWGGVSVGSWIRDECVIILLPQCLCYLFCLRPSLESRCLCSCATAVWPGTDCL